MQRSHLEILKMIVIISKKKKKKTFKIGEGISLNYKVLLLLNMKKLTLTTPCIVERPITGWLSSFSWGGRDFQSLKKGVCRTRSGAPGHLARPNTLVYSVLSSSINFLLYVGWAKLSKVATNLEYNSNITFYNCNNIMK